MISPRVISFFGCCSPVKAFTDLNFNDRSVYEKDDSGSNCFTGNCLGCCL